MERKEIEALNKKLNRRMLTLERKGLTGIRDYEELVKLAKKSGATNTKTGKIRFKENLKTLEKEGKLKNVEQFSKLASFYGSGKKSEKINEIRKRFETKTREIASADTLSDILEAQKSTKGESSLWNRLKQYFDSDQIVEIFNERIPGGISLSNKFDWIENAFSGKIIDEDIMIDYLKGFISEKEVLEFIKRA